MNSMFLRKLRVAITPRNWLLRTRLENGALVTGYNRTGWGGRGVYIFRDALEPELRSLSHFLKRGDVFVDIGANVGVFTVKAAKEVGDSGVVIAIEPFIESARQLSRNISLNRFRNCRVRNFCVAQTTGETKFFLNRDKPNDCSLVRDSGTDPISVFCVSLDDLCAWERIARLDYLKIDAEGAEDMILRGGTASIQRFRPIIQVEIILNRIDLPHGYRRFSLPPALNNVLIPSERLNAIETAKALGWIESSD
jgi:FkbM family methyltransferase